jgi:16S rRNA (adenine1518-N6/adenine1519-N6)-dimethyltransferase
VRPRKSLGQHFLTHPALLARIAAATGAGPGDVVLEIGPGKGGLTAALLDRGATVVAIERDEALHARLNDAFGRRDFALIAGDALEADWAALVAPWTTQGKRWLVVGNIPYYITSPLLAKALSAPLPAGVIFLVQREVADRIVAPAGAEDYGALSVGIQAVARARKLLPVGKAAFTPPPKVDSALIELVPRADPLVAPERIGEFRRLVTSLFSYRRKRMVRALRQAADLSASEAETVLTEAVIDFEGRPETVSPEGFVRLLEAMTARVAPAPRS